MHFIETAVARAVTRKAFYNKHSLNPLSTLSQIRSRFTPRAKFKTFSSNSGAVLLIEGEIVDPGVPLMSSVL